jgi:two-component sensor histidine kinase
MEEQTARILLKNFFDLSTDLMCICSRAGKIVEVNQAWQTSLNWHRDEVRSQSWLDLLHPEDRAIAAQQWSKLVNSGSGSDRDHALEIASSSSKAKSNPGLVSGSTDSVDQKVASGKLNKLDKAAQSSQSKFSTQASQGSSTNQITNLQVGMLSHTTEYIQVNWQFSIAEDGSVCGIGRLVNRLVNPSATINQDADSSDSDKQRSPIDLTTSPVNPTEQNDRFDLVDPDPAMLDQINSIDAIDAISEIKKQPEYAHNGKGTTSLAYDRQLEAELKEKDLLLREIHHRIKNNLQVISSLLDLQAQRITAPEIVTMFQESQHRIRTMALIHERLCQSSEFSRIDIDQYIQSLIDYLQYSYMDQLMGIQIHLNTQPTYLEIDKAIPCGLIVNELVTNSFKHAFPQAQPGNISISLEQVQGKVILIISNDGVPFPSSVKIDSFQTLGLQLVNVLVQQLDGSIELDPSNGTKFTIQFPA